MSLPLVPPWRISAHSDKTLFSLSSTSQVLVPYRSIGFSLQEFSNHADLFLSAVGVDLHFSTSWFSFWPSFLFFFFFFYVVVVFFSIGFCSWAQVPWCLCCVSSSGFVELKSLFFFIPNSLSSLFFCFSLTFCKAWSKLCSSKLLPFHSTDPSSSLLSWAYVTTSGLLLLEGWLCPLLATTQSCSFSCATSHTHLTVLLAVSGIYRKAILKSFWFSLLMG